MIGIVIADYVAAVFTLIILLGLYTNIDKKVSLSVRYFRLCAWLCLAGLILDGLVYIVTNSTRLRSLGPAFTYFSYDMTDGLLIAFALYFQSIAEGDRKRPGKLITAIIVLACVDFIFYTVGTVSGKLFYFENGATVAGPWYSYATVLASISVTLQFIYIMINRKTLGRTYTLVMCSFFVFTIISGVVFFLFPFFNLSYIATALTVVMSYVFIQSKAIAEANVRAETYNSMSIRDYLTGLKNRRGFNDYVLSLPPETEVCVFFCDINGLKKVNDNYGHKDGDLLIKRTADILLNSFPDGESFRMSGDEFIVILKLNESIDFGERSALLKKVLSDNDEIAVFGSAKGRISELIELERHAEAGMYAEKKLYYARSGIER